ncbi:peptidoglycan recognition protein family protein [Lysinibacillus fusiformis]|uniref:peptidoglycan recognition protein family protein n=1 Tax=Lysinibacillus fusiformis TaxID=28031 RepID=UPI003D033690
MVQIRQHLVSAAVAIKVTGGRKNTRRKVCIHETDNTKKGSGADNHAQLQAKGNSRQASWHWSVDDREAIQSFTHDYQCWAAGSTQGNNEAIHIEMCVNSDGDYVRTVQNTAALVAKILKDESLTINDVVQHNFYSGKKLS